MGWFNATLIRSRNWVIQVDSDGLDETRGTIVLGCHVGVFVEGVGTYEDL